MRLTHHRGARNLSQMEVVDPQLPFPATAQRLELAFMVEVTSGDMSLLFEVPGTVFDNARMIDELGCSGGSTPGRHDRIAGAMEVGSGKPCARKRGKVVGRKFC